jgi:hypothetical protein
VEKAKEEGYELGIVSYRGCGRYHGQVYHPFTNITDHPDMLQGDQVAVQPPENSTWWPVINLVRPPRLRTAGSIVLICFYQLQCTEPFAWDFEV